MNPRYLSWLLGVLVLGCRAERVAGPPTLSGAAETEADGPHATPPLAPAALAGDQVHDAPKLVVQSDLAEQLCFVGAPVEGAESVVHMRFDCDTGKATGELKGTPELVGVTLDALAARTWEEIQSDAEHYEWMKDWVRMALPDPAAPPTLYRSPSGAHIVAVVPDDTAQPGVIFSAWPAPPTIALVVNPDEGDDDAVTFGFPAISHDGSQVAYIAWHNTGMSGFKDFDLVIAPTRSMRPAKTFPLDDEPTCNDETLAKRVAAAQKALSAGQWRAMRPVESAPESSGTMWFENHESEDDEGVIRLSTDGGLLFRMERTTLTVDRAGESHVWQRGWPRNVVKAAGTTYNETGKMVPCPSSKGATAYIDEGAGWLFLEIYYSGFSDICGDPDSDHLMYALPNAKSAFGWKQAPRDGAPGWLDLPDYTDEAPKLAASQAEHIEEVLGHWEGRFPKAPGVVALRAVLDEYRAKTPVPAR